MDCIKTPKNKIFFEEKKSKINNIKLLSNRNRKIFKTIYSKLTKNDEIKPADPLINRKFIKLNPIKYPSITPPKLELPIFNYKSLKISENFTLIPNNKNNKINYLKEIQINNYINTSYMLQRLIYSKKPPDKDGHVTIENIINLNELNEINSKAKKGKNKDDIIEDKLNISDNLSNLGITKEDIIDFESNFECGNLQLVYLINSSKENKDEKIYNNYNINNYNNKEYDVYQLFLHNDTNTTGYSQWFFFRVTNGKKNQKINLNIMNFQRKRTRYSNGTKIWYYSKKKNEEKNIGWHHTKENVEYYQNFLYRFIKGKRQYYYTLSFDYTFQYDNDEIYFANCIPFTYSDIIRDLNEYTKQENEKYFYFERKRLCSTIIGNDVDYFNINNNIDILNFEKTNNKKKGIVLFSRQHPGETVGSWALKGAIEFLMGNSNEAKYLRDNFIIKIIPMVNVDGVICGNSRTSLAGCDLNRRWINPNEYIYPEIYYLKELIYNFVNKIKVEYIIDFHGHFGIFNSFFYANNNKNDISYCKYFPFICGKISKIIQFNKSKFKMPKYKRGTGRINLYKELNIENIFTLETSYFGCNEGEYINQYFNTDKLKEIGRDICNGILLSNYNSYLRLKLNINEINNENLNSNLKYSIENNINKINKEFDEYINKLKNNFYLTNDNKNIEYKKDEDKNEEDPNNEKNENGDDDGKGEGADDDDDDESDSESEPSRDNLKEEEIKILLPFFKKKKSIKKSKKNINLKNFHIIKKNHMSLIKNNNIQRSQHKMSSFPKIDSNQTLITKNNNNILTINHILYNNLRKQKINLSNKFLYKNRIRKYSPLIIIKNKSNTNINTKKTVDKQTQTEEKFFIMHWSAFFGIYKILTSKYDDKKSDESFSFMENKFHKNKNIRINPFNNILSPSAITSFNRNHKDNKNDSDQNHIYSRNNQKVKKIFNSDYYEKNNYLTKYIKKDIQQSSYSSEQRIKEQNNIKIKHKIKDKGNSIQKVITSFISNITNFNKNDFLKRYLSNEDRITGY